MCSEEFELKPDKPGFANRCPVCSAEEAEEAAEKQKLSSGDRDLDAARRGAMRDMLYRKDS